MGPDDGSWQCSGPRRYRVNGTGFHRFQSGDPPSAPADNKDFIGPLEPQAP
jgi:hypothetical protein